MKTLKLLSKVCTSKYQLYNVIRDGNFENYKMVFIMFASELYM